MVSELKARDTTNNKKVIDSKEKMASQSTEGGIDIQEELNQQQDSGNDSQGAAEARSVELGTSETLDMLPIMLMKVEESLKANQREKRRKMEEMHSRLEENQRKMERMQMSFEEHNKKTKEIFVKQIKKRKKNTC